MDALDLGHACRRLRGKIGSIDQVAVARLGDSSHVEIYWEVKVTEICRYIGQACRPVGVDEFVNRPLSQIGAQVAQADVQNSTGIEYVGIAKCSAQVLV